MKWGGALLTLIQHYDTIHTRWLLYVTTAFLISVHTSIATFDDFDSISIFFMVKTFLYALIQSLIAWRAYIDRSTTLPETPKAGQNSATPAPVADNTKLPTIN